jgi:1,4-dihydroxy-2-naphthoyl-CoA hydrolase
MSTTIWRTKWDLDRVNELAGGTMIEHLGIEYVELGSDFIRGTMPVDERTIQPYGLLHGGASVTLAETLGSMAANMCVDPASKMCVGLEISANHVRQVRAGVVTGTARPLHIGARTHVWEIRVEDESERLVSICRLTILVLERESGTRRETT